MNLEPGNERHQANVEVVPVEPSGAIRPDGSPLGSGITVYGADWCGDTRRSRALLDRLGLAYADVDVDAHPTAGAWAAAQNGGERRIPVVVLGAGGATLIVPSDDAMLAALRRTGYLDPVADDAPSIAGRTVGRGSLAARQDGFGSTGATTLRNEGWGR